MSHPINGVPNNSGLRFESDSNSLESTVSSAENRSSRFSKATLLNFLSRLRGFVSNLNPIKIFSRNIEGHPAEDSMVSSGSEYSIRPFHDNDSQNEVALYENSVHSVCGEESVEEQRDMVLFKRREDGEGEVYITGLRDDD